MTAASATAPAEEPRLLTVAEYVELGETPSRYSELTEGRVGIAEPFPVALDLAALL